MRAVNLIPAEHRTGTSVGMGRSQGAAYGVLVLAGGLALMAFLYARADKQISSSKDAAATLTAQAQRAQSQAAQLSPYASFIAMREQRLKTISALVDSRFDWAHAFHEFGRVLPASVSVSSLTGNITPSGGTSGAAPAAAATSTPAAAPAAAAGGAAATAATAASVTPPGSVPVFSLAGCAKSQPDVALMLDRLRLIDGVANVTLQSSAKSAAGAAGGCGSGQPAYTAQITYHPLPTPEATRAATAVVATAGSPAKSTGGAR